MKIQQEFSTRGRTGLSSYPAHRLIHHCKEVTSKIINSTMQEEYLWIKIRKFLQTSLTTVLNKMSEKVFVALEGIPPSRSESDVFDALLAMSIYPIDVHKIMYTGRREEETYFCLEMYRVHQGDFLKIDQLMGYPITTFKASPTLYGFTCSNCNTFGHSKETCPVPCSCNGCLEPVSTSSQQTTNTTDQTCTSNESTESSVSDRKLLDNANKILEFQLKKLMQAGYLIDSDAHELDSTDHLNSMFENLTDDDLMPIGADKPRQHVMKLQKQLSDVEFSCRGLRNVNSIEPHILETTVVHEASSNFLKAAINQLRIRVDASSADGAAGSAMKHARNLLTEVQTKKKKLSRQGGSASKKNKRE